jgi:hypothetical protein
MTQPIGPPPPKAPLLPKPVVATPKPAQAAPTPAATKPDRFDPTPATPFGAPASGPPGAYYRKVVSGMSAALAGIHGTGVLPTPAFDSKRVSKTAGPQDVPDVYLGGTSAKGAEVDCGLAWNQVHDANARPLFTDNASGTDGGPNGPDKAHQFYQVGQAWYQEGGQRLAARDPRIKKLTPDFAYHPYFRTDYQGKNAAGNHDPSDHRLVYYYPGQAFKMQFSVDPKGAATLSVNSPTGPSFAAHFDAPGFGGSARSFKRCIAIDQFGAEKAKHVVPTQTSLTGGGWDSVGLLPAAGGPELPLTAQRGTLVGGSDTLGRYGSIYRPSRVNAAGGEYVDITPGGKA